MIFPALGVNTKVVDIGLVYLNMLNEQNRVSRFRANWQRVRFRAILAIKVPK